MPFNARHLHSFLLATACLAPICATAIAQTPAHLVVTGPAAGRHAEYLGAMAEAAQRAMGQRPHSLTDADDGCDAGRARGTARMIVALKPDLVLGHPCPAAAIAAAPIYAEAGVIFFALGVRHPDLTDKRAGPTIFRLAGRDDRQGEAAAAALSDAAPGGRIAIVQDRTAYARGLLAETTAALTARQKPAPVVIPLVAGRRDYTPEIEKLMAAQAEAILFAGYPSEAGVLLRGLRKAGFNGVFIGSDANATPEFADAVIQGGLGGGGVKVLTRAGPVAERSASGLGTAAATAVEAWLAGVDRAESGTPADVASAISRAPFKTTTMGILSFDSRGDAELTSFVAAALVDGRWSAAASQAR